MWRSQFLQLASEGPADFLHLFVLKIHLGPITFSLDDDEKLPSLNIAG